MRPSPRPLSAGFVGGAVTLAALAAVVGAVYSVILIGLGRPPSGDERTLLALSAVAAAVSALVWSAVRPRVRELARTVAGTRRPSGDEVLGAFRRRVTRELPLDELLLQLAESLRESFSLESAEIWTGSDGIFRRAVSDPELPPARQELTADEEAVVVRTGVGGAAWAETWLADVAAGRADRTFRVAAAASAGRLLGLLVVTRAPGAPQLRPDDEQTLAEAGRQIGVLLHTARLDSALQASLVQLRRRAEELRASRMRVVSAADRERRRIERDLHDGAQQRLVGLAVKARLARELAEQDPGSVVGVLDELGLEIEDAIDELRALAHGIFPPVLAERGLHGALVGVGRLAGLPVEPTIETDARYAPEVEAAVYFCCLEALQNAAKHGGGATRAHLSLAEIEGALVFEVRDDGPGFDPRSSRSGAGLTNMADRLGAIGGRLRVESTLGGGTRVTGTIPLDRHELSAR